MNKRNRFRRVISLLLAVTLIFSGTAFPTEASGEMLSGTAKESSYEISSADTFPTEIPAGETYTLTKNITLKDGQQIENLAGTLDGNGYRITLADKPLAKNISGTVQNLGVTSGKQIVSKTTFGSMAETLSGTIQNCYSTADIKLEWYDGEIGGIVGTLDGGTIQNTYFAGKISSMFGEGGGMAAVNTKEESVLNQCAYTVAAPLTLTRPEPHILNCVRKSVEQFKSGEVNEWLNQNRADTGFYFALPEDESNGGLPILKKGSPQTEGADKTVLRQYIAQANGLREEEYTKDSWHTLQEALNGALETEKKENAGQEEINAACDTLREALELLEKKKVTTPVAPPNDAENIISITSQADLENIQAENEKGYYVLENDITIQGMYMPMGEFQGVLDGRGHTVTFADGFTGIFDSLGKNGVLQNIHFTGTLSNDVGPAGIYLKGVVVNCYSDVKGDSACGFARELKGGMLANSYSVSAAKKGVLFKRYTAGNLLYTYWQDDLKNPISFPEDALQYSGVKSEEELKTKAFAEALNEHRGEYGTKWGQSSNGYAYFGEHQEYQPDKPENPQSKYPITFTPVGTDKPVQVEDGIVNVSPDEATKPYYTVGQLKAENVPQTSKIEWTTGEVKPEGSIGVGLEDGMVSVWEDGKATVTAVEVKADGSRENVAVIEIQADSREIDEIKLRIDGTDVTNGTYTVAGSEEKRVEVQAKYVGDDEFHQVISSRFDFQVSDETMIYHMEGSGSFSFEKPGTASITVVSKKDETKKAKVELTSTFVPVESIEQTIPDHITLHARNANSDRGKAFLPEYAGVIVKPENASNYKKWTIESSRPEVAEYVVSMVHGYVPYKAGTTTYTAKLTEINPNTREEHTVTNTKEVTYSYLNPLTSVTADKEQLTLENNEEQNINLTFKGERSDENYSVTEPELQWTYDKEGIVQIGREQEGYWKRDENAPDKNLYLPTTEYKALALQEGTVVATGTPVDQTGGAKPIQLTITVGKGSEPQTNLDTVVKTQIKQASDYIEKNYTEYQYNDEWALFSLIRAGKAVDGEKKEAYYSSIEDTVKKWALQPNEVKPTEIERVALTLTLLEKDITNIFGKNVAEMIYNHEKLKAGSNEIAYALIALDAGIVEIPKDAKWTREKMVDALLGFQNTNGGFGLYDNSYTSVDATAMVLQALANDREKPEVQQAIEKAIVYLKDAMYSHQYDFGNVEGNAQVIIALSALGIDLADEKNGFGNATANILTRLQEYYCEETGGYAHSLSNKKPNKIATTQVLQAAEAYRRFKSKENTYWDLTDMPKYSEPVKAVIQAIDTLPSEEKLTLEDEEQVKDARNLYNQLAEKLRKKVTNYEKLQKAEEKILSLKNPIGAVEVSVLDGHTKMLDKKQISIYQEDSMMSAIARACELNGLDIEIRDNGTYIESINGLAEFDAGLQSGWKGTLNGLFTDISFAETEIKDGDVITVEYTHDLGKDLEENAELRTLGLSGGKITPEFSRSAYQYVLHLENDVENISFKPETYSRYSEVTIRANGEIYEAGQEIPVVQNMKVEISSHKTMRGEETKTYAIDVKVQEAKPETPPVTITNEKYGISLHGKGITPEMTLEVTPLRQDDEVVTLMRKEVSTTKGVFKLFHIALTKDGKEISLPDKAILSVEVGDKYNDTELTVLHHNGKQLEKLTGKVREGEVQTEIGQLGDFGVVVDLEEEENIEQSGGVKTGDAVGNYTILFLFAAMSASGIYLVGRKKRSENI